MRDSERAVSLPRDLSSLRSARNFVRETFSFASPADRDSAELIVSELVTNALEHGKGEIVVRAVAREGSLYLSVSDDESNEPQLRQVNATSSRGRGLLIVDRLSSRWGVTPSAGGGKAVWAAIDSPTADPGNA